MVVAGEEVVMVFVGKSVVGVGKVVVGRMVVVGRVVVVKLVVRGVVECLLMV